MIAQRDPRERLKQTKSKQSHNLPAIAELNQPSSPRHRAPVPPEPHTINREGFERPGWTAVEVIFKRKEAHTAVYSNFNTIINNRWSI